MAKRYRYRYPRPLREIAAVFVMRQSGRSVTEAGIKTVTTYPSTIINDARYFCRSLPAVLARIEAAAVVLTERKNDFALPSHRPDPKRQRRRVRG